MIKVTVGEQKTQEEKPYPKFMTIKDEWANKGTIVLFHKKESGIVVFSTGAHKVGFYSNAWAMADFTDYNETITLQNI